MQIMLDWGPQLTRAPASGMAPPEAVSTSTASVSASAQVVPSPPHTPHSSTSPACTQRRARVTPGTRQATPKWVRCSFCGVLMHIQLAFRRFMHAWGRSSSCCMLRAALHAAGAQGPAVRAMPGRTRASVLQPSASCITTATQEQACQDHRQRKGYIALAWQQRPCASRAPLVQQAPSTSTARAAPPHTPHTSTCLPASHSSAGAPSQGAQAVFVLSYCSNAAHLGNTKAPRQCVWHVKP